LVTAHRRVRTAKSFHRSSSTSPSTRAGSKSLSIPKTNDPEEAYRQLLDVRRATTEGVRLFPSAVSRIRYEDLRTILLDYYREHKPRSIIKRATREISTAQEISSLRKSLRVPTSWISSSNECRSLKITALKIADYVKWRRKEGDAEPTIRRQFGNLRSAFTQAKALDLTTASHIATFVLPARLKTSKRIFRSSGIQYSSRRCSKNCDPRLRSCTSADVDQELRRKLHGR
jgi:hypothetical protein